MPDLANKFVKPGAKALAIALALGGAYEGERLVAYHDPGNGTLTICDGETHGVFVGMTKTHDECIIMFSAGMGQRLAFVEANRTVPMTEPRKAAFADFAYNEGGLTLLNSQAWKLINNGNIVNGCHAMLNYTRAGQKHLDGLRRRRMDECELCVLGVPHEKDICYISPTEAGE